MRQLRTPLLLVGVLAAPLTAQADVVLDWNAVLLDAVRVDKTAPPKSSRAMAIMHLAIFDAVNAIDGSYESYHASASATAGASAEAAVAAAAHKTLVALFPAQQAAFDAALETSLAAIADGDAKTDGIELGEAVADEILALRADDGSADVVVYEPGSDVGDWIPTPPAFAATVLPQWPDVTPFAMTSRAQFRGDGPPALESDDYAAACNEVKLIGRVDSTARSAEQTEIALFWINGPGTSTPPGHWNQIAQIIAEQKGNTLVENARLFALLNVALADAAIVSWDNKYHYNHWRPVTAIQQADVDGNPTTEADPGWTSFIPTPAFPEYTSGHSTFSGAGSRVLEKFYDTDEISFMTNSDASPDVVRSYTSLSQAADESGKSRIYGGIHFQYANEDGLSSGRELADHVVANYLKAVDDGDGDSGGVRLCGILSIGQFTAMMLMLGALRFAPTRRRGSRT